MVQAGVNDRKRILNVFRRFLERQPNLFSLLFLENGVKHIILLLFLEKQ